MPTSVSGGTLALVDAVGRGRAADRRPVRPALDQPRIWRTTACGRSRPMADHVQPTAQSNALSPSVISARINLDAPVEGMMDKLSLHNPLFNTYVVAATLMILKVVGMSWLTVMRMMQVKGGFRSPEDLKKTALNPHPNPTQTQPNESVDRIRRMQLNDLENVPFFLVAGFLFVLTDPPLLLAQWLLYGYVISRFAHFAAYFTARTHDTRAALWTIGSLMLVFITCWTLVAVLRV
ncbi:MAPEG family protein [Phenylobacterium sp.]|uniref:MAPEG family protein n=2 Tax=Phenylobacterium sp. TaxID=1871053 RepID=UPI0027346490|nr:MAPEG family protein [Phenylobacterium sp.]MDP3634989.1 MAPEG family protein [Phenylobacterium sp.]